MSWNAGAEPAGNNRRGTEAPAARSNRFGKQSDRVAQTSATSGYHRVVDGETLYSIAWRYQLDYRNLAAWNGRKNSSLIYAGERLRLTPPVGGSGSAAAITAQAPGSFTGRAGSKRVFEVEKTNENNSLPTKVAIAKASEIAWRWPAKGTVSEVFYGAESKLKGLLIAGQLGQAVEASADGTVVYIGSGLARYGQLVIIKHSENFFSAYAHLQRIGVQQGQWVQSGQQIATMGTITGNDRVALRFDIRNGAVSLDPLALLPKSQG